jgi:hypothetical protein
MLTFCASRLNNSPPKLGRVDVDKLVIRGHLPIVKKVMNFKKILMSLLSFYLLFGIALLQFWMKRSRVHGDLKRVVLWPLVLLKHLLLKLL